MTLNDVCKEAAKWITDFMRQAGKKVINKKKLSKFEEELAKNIEKKLEKDGSFEINFDFETFPYDDLVKRIAKDFGVEKGLSYIPSDASVKVVYNSSEKTVIIKKERYDSFMDQRYTTDNSFVID